MMGEMQMHYKVTTTTTHGLKLLEYWWELIMMNSSKTPPQGQMLVLCALCTYVGTYLFWPDMLKVHSHLVLRDSNVESTNTMLVI
jgi:hypothetical protein